MESRLERLLEDLCKKSAIMLKINEDGNYGRSIKLDPKTGNVMYVANNRFLTFISDKIADDWNEEYEKEFDALLVKAMNDENYHKFTVLEADRRDDGSWYTVILKD